MKGEWLRKPTANTTVVFVHGFLSSGETCWKHDNGSNWPELLKNETELSALGIYVFTYPTNFFSRNYDLGRVVDDLREALKLDQILASQHIIFVCHSMGGIVVREYLHSRQADIFGVIKSIGLVLVASPSLGAEYAEWLKPLSQFLGHAQADALRLADDNRWLNDLDRKFKNLIGSKELVRHQLSIKGKELTEENLVELIKWPVLLWFWRFATFRWKQLVPPISGERYFPDPKMISGSDHFSIAKPANNQAEQHRLLCQFIKENFPLQTSPPEKSDPVATAQGTVPHGSAVTPGTVPRAVATGSTSDQRTLELDYLVRLQEEERLNQEKQTQMYTPLGGVSRQRPEMRAAYDLVRVGKDRQQETKPFENAVERIRDIRQVVLLGEPGGGKTTTIWKLAVDLVETAIQNPQAPIPLLIRLGRWTEAKQSLPDFIASQLGELGQQLDSLLKEKRTALLLDGLNELPVSHRDDKYPQVQKFIKLHKNLLAVVSCRKLDYEGKIDLGFDLINITPLDPLRIREFVRRYLRPDEGEILFWKLAGQPTQRQYELFRQEFADKLEEPEQTFWIESELPTSVNWGRSWRGENDNSSWQDWLKLREEPSSLMVMARNPYMLSMLTFVFAKEGKIPENRGELFREFVEELLERECNLLPEESEQEVLRKEQKQLTADLTRLAFTMQSRRDQDNQGNASTSLPQAEAQTILTEQQLYLARSASILSLGEQVRFSHQLLQEYFAAKFMDIEFRAKRLNAAQLWPRDRWWERTNWEEAAILLTGLYSSDCTDVILWLADANPEVAAQCLDIERSGAQLATETREATLRQLRDKWLPRLTDVKLEPSPLARAAVGRALGMTGLDNRKGVGVVGNLPDIDWVEIPGGEFQYGSEEEYSAKPELISLPTFSISRYPITYAQFQAFLDDPKGYDDPRWFEGLAADDEARQRRDQSFKFANHPRETVNWYQAMAFCRWLSWRLGGGYDLKQVDDWAVRLPTEFEWEKAARGIDGRTYPYQGDYDPAKGNTSDTKIGQTNAVGIFPHGASPYGVQEMSGNVWEWCLSNYDNPASEARKENLRNEVTRVLRGGSWVSHLDYARAASRFIYFHPSDRNVSYGFRVSRWCRPPS